MTNRSLLVVLSAALGASLVACIPQDEHRVGDNGSGGASGVTPGSGGSAPAGPIALSITPTEAATRLSETLWGMAPEAGWLAAVTPSLATNESVRGLAEQMLTDSKARSAIGAFYRHWFSLDTIADKTKDAALFPEWNATLGGDMASESELYAVDVTLSNFSAISELLTSHTTFLNQRLAPIYGVTDVVGFEMRRVSLGSPNRAGLLTQPGFQVMAATSRRNSPTWRGKFIQERLLCAQVPPPPANVPPLSDTPIPAPGSTLREALATHRSNPACAACHNLMDPIGFGYEGFDVLGRERTEEAGRPVDVTGTISLQSGPRTFNGPIELAGILADAPELHRCFAQRWLSFALGRDVNSSDRRDQRSVDEVLAYARLNKLFISSMIAAALSSEAFLAP